MSALQIKAAVLVSGLGIGLVLVVAGQWNLWAWLAGAAWGACSVGAMEWERIGREWP